MVVFNCNCTTSASWSSSVNFLRDSALMPKAKDFSSSNYSLFACFFNAWAERWPSLIFQWALVKVHSFELLQLKLRIFTVVFLLISNCNLARPFFSQLSLGCSFINGILTKNYFRPKVFKKSSARRYKIFPFLHTSVNAAPLQMKVRLISQNWPKHQQQALSKGFPNIKMIDFYD